MLKSYSKKFVFIFVGIISIGLLPAQKFKSPKNNFSGKEILDVPFGTLVKMKIRIFDGDSLKMKRYGHTYLIDILEINDKKLKTPIRTNFISKTYQIPANNRSLYELLNDEEVSNGLSSEVIKEMKKEYVGKEYDVIAYESGGFIGNPNMGKYVRDHVKNYHMMEAAAPSFQFDNYIIIEDVLTESYK